MDNVSQDIVSCYSALTGEIIYFGILIINFSKHTYKIIPLGDSFLAGELFDEIRQPGTLIVDLKHWKEMSGSLPLNIMYQGFIILQNSLEIDRWHDITWNRTGITPLTIVFFQQYEYSQHSFLSKIRGNNIMRIDSD